MILPSLLRTLKTFKQVALLYRDYKSKNPVCSQPPFRLWVDLTTVCNLRCTICPQSIRKLEPMYMDFKLFTKIIDELKDYVFDINLAVTGESLLHPQLADMIRYASQNRVISRLHTSATVLTDELSSNIIKSGLRYISFSVDGFDKETYERIRVGAKYWDTIENIKNFLVLKKRLRSPIPYVVIKTVVNPDEMDTVKRVEFENRFNGLPVDRFRINPLHNFGGKMEDIQFSRSKSAVCYVVWFGLAILADGKIVPCCMDFWGDYLIGDAKKEKVLDLWNGNRMVALRQKLINGQANDIKLCGGCYLSYAQKGLRGQLIKDTFAFLKEYGTIIR